jgi:hypothetical protein
MRLAIRLPDKVRSLVIDGDADAARRMVAKKLRKLVCAAPRQIRLVGDKQPESDLHAGRPVQQCHCVVVSTDMSSSPILGLQATLTGQI